MHAAVRNISKDIRRLQDLEKKRRKRREAETGLTWLTLRTAMCIASLARWDFSVAADWVCNAKRRGYANTLSDFDLDEVTAKLEDLFIKLGLDILLEWADGSPDNDAVPASIIRTAAQWVASRSTVKWVQTSNQNFGEAVRSDRVIEHYNALIKPWVDSEHMMEVCPLTENPGRAWVKHWRRKHLVKIGKIRAADTITLEEKRIKARAQKSDHQKVKKKGDFWKHFLHQFWQKTRPESGPKSRPILRACF